MDAMGEQPAAAAVLRSGCWNESVPMSMSAPDAVRWAGGVHVRLYGLRAGRIPCPRDPFHHIRPVSRQGRIREAGIRTGRGGRRKGPERSCVQALETERAWLRASALSLDTARSFTGDATWT